MALCSQVVAVGATPVLGRAELCWELSKLRKVTSDPLLLGIDGSVLTDYLWLQLWSKRMARRRRERQAWRYRASSQATCSLHVIHGSILTVVITGGRGVELMLVPLAEALGVYSGLVKEASAKQEHDPWADQTHASGGLLAALRGQQGELARLRGGS